MSDQPIAAISPEEYLERERRAEDKSEYRHGEIFARPSASLVHAKLAVIVGSLRNIALRGRDCEVYTSDLRLHIPASGVFTYPDVSVGCSLLVEDVYAGVALPERRALR